jgi:hypothetical protein
MNSDASMALRPLPLPLWDRKAGKLVDEFMDDTASTYESQRSVH